VMQDVSIRGQGEQESGIGALVASGWSESGGDDGLVRVVDRLTGRTRPAQILSPS